MHVGRTKTEITRGTPRPDVEEPVYVMSHQNHQGATGRPINHREVFTFEDLVALHAALGKIVSRETDHVTVVSQPAGTHVFKEIPHGRS